MRSGTDVKSGGLRVLCGCDRLLVDAATEASLGKKRHDMGKWIHSHHQAFSYAFQKSTSGVGSGFYSLSIDYKNRITL